MRSLFSLLYLVILCAPGASAEERNVNAPSNAFNPAISINALATGEISSPGADSDGFKLQEVEMALSSVVDPYFKLDTFVGFEPASDGPDVEGVALEEVYITTTSLPPGWGIRAGRFFSPFGRHNQLHAHAYPFVHPPLAVRSILGEESVGDVGIEAAYLPSLPWYLNLRIYTGDGAVEGVFDGDSRSLAVGGRIENLWELSESSTLEAAVSVWDGPTEDSRRTLYGLDIRIKNRDPRRTHGRIVEWVTEVLLDPDTAEDSTGLYSLLRTRVSRRTWVGAGFSLVSRKSEIGLRERSYELRGQVAFAPSEFSALRAEVVWPDPETFDEFMILGQLNITIGSHSAHTY